MSAGATAAAIFGARGRLLAAMPRRLALLATAIAALLVDDVHTTGATLAACAAALAAAGARSVHALTYARTL